jgi:hypothetical protein
MGLFDTVHCEYSLPDPKYQDLEFQTKDLDCFLLSYTITGDGRLIRHARRGGRGPEQDVEWPIHGDIRIYTSIRDGSGDHTWIEYVVRFTHGRVEWIRPREEVPPDPEPPDWELSPEVLEIFKRKADPALPAAPPAAPGETAVSSAEEALLQSLRRDRGELEKLLQESSNHWGYEDPVYRFYHQSFKVYSLQHQTESIVRRLQALAPDRPLNPWFLQIVESGTGKEFRSEDNAHWTEVTRPIVEAFFHARFFLEMAVRYADVPAPPQSLPSGYAALLYLFGLR